MNGTHALTNTATPSTIVISPKEKLCENWMMTLSTLNAHKSQSNWCVTHERLPNSKFKYIRAIGTWTGRSLSLAEEQPTNATASDTSSSVTRPPIINWKAKNNSDTTGTARLIYLFIFTSRCAMCFVSIHLPFIYRFSFIQWVDEVPASTFPAARPLTLTCSLTPAHPPPK